VRNLYLKLGVEPGAGIEDIAAALELHPELSAYAPILLDAKKRAAYDRTHAALSAIGELRHQLGLNDGNSWFLEKYPGFARMRRSPSSAGTAQAAAQTSVPTETREAARREGRRTRRTARYKWLVPVLSGLALIVVLLLMYTFF
jgi:hypothetical protein